jgi:carbonic anhydrase
MIDKKSASADSALRTEYVPATPVPMRLFSFTDLEENTRAQIESVRSHPWIAKDVPVRGFIFDVDTGRGKSSIDDRRTVAA